MHHKPVAWGSEGPQPATLRVGGDSPVLGRIMGISVSPQVATLFNKGVWDSKAKQWRILDMQRSVEGDATHLPKYMKGAPSLQAAQYSAYPLLRRPGH